MNIYVFVYEHKVRYLYNYKGEIVLNASGITLQEDSD